MGRELLIGGKTKTCEDAAMVSMKLRIRSIVICGLLSCGLTGLMAEEFKALPEYQPTIEKALATAGENRAELTKALESVPANQSKAMQFLISYMPESDWKTIKADLLLKNVAWAYKARETFPWAKSVPEDVFFNDVEQPCERTQKTQRITYQILGVLICKRRVMVG